MSQYSELMGSFLRTGNFPLEANYVFETEDDLKEFYSDAINATTLHEGLLKVVLDAGDGEQALYWVVANDEGELEFVKLIEKIDIETLSGDLSDLLEKLEQEISDREDADQALWGTNDPTNIPEDVNSIMDLANAVQELQASLQELDEASDDTNDKLKAVVGTTDNDIVSYLQTLPYESLTAVAEALDKFMTQVDESTTTIDTWPELQAFLKGYTDSDTLADVLEQFMDDIYGSPIPSDDFRTLRGIEDFVRTAYSWAINRTDNLQSELDQTQVGVGLSGDGSFNADQETYYLQDATSVMNALKTLDSLVYEALQGITITATNPDVVELEVTKQASGYMIGANLLVSNVYGNDIIKKSDGIYVHVISEYDDGILTLKVNDNIVAQHVLGLSSIVDSAYYDTSNEQIVMVFKLDSGDTQTVNIPVGALIREWEPDNTNADRVVELYRETVVDGADKLSADVRISTKTHNILEKDNNTLYVGGTSDNITHNGTNLDTVIDALQESSDSTSAALTEEISRATLAETTLTLSLENEVARATAAEDTLTSSLEAEVTRATAAEAVLTADLKTEVARATEAEQAIASDLQSEISRATLAEQTISSSLENEVTRATAAEATLTSSIESEITRATAAEAVLTADLKTEVARAMEAEDKLEDALDAEILRATTAEQSISSSLESEITRSTNVDDVINSALTAEITRATTAETEIKDALNAEILRATTEEITLTTNLNAEITRATAAEENLDEDLTAHVNDRDNPHRVTATQIGSYLTTEIDAMLALKADLVDGVIPAEQLPSSLITWIEVE